jgi:hypothetical protein
MVPLLVAAASVAGAGAYAQALASPDAVWQTTSAPQAGQSARATSGPQGFVALDKPALDAVLSQAPPEGPAGAATAGVELTLPMPDGSFTRFRVAASPILAPELAAAFPEIRTFRAQGIDDPTATARLGWTATGFHAIVLGETGTVMVDPAANGNISVYVSVRKGDIPAKTGFQCLVQDTTPPGLLRAENSFPFTNGTLLRTYRMALAATGEYTVDAGGTKALALSRMTATMNRVNGIYERELAVRLIVATGTGADPTALIYTDGSTDPYTNDDGSAMLDENQATLDAVVGTANYDVGHVFSTGGGGIAMLGTVCRSSDKAHGVTGMSDPVGDAFAVDYVAHEIGHQFGGSHTFNSESSSCGGGNRNAAHAYEVGSGSTIQAYAGICSPENLQPHSHDYFHVESLDEMTAFITSGSGSTCGSTAATGNTPPTVNAGAAYTIPARTPFALSGTATDPDGDALTYVWEQFDLGTASSSVATATTDDGSRPLFRSHAPASGGATRTFPSLSSVLNSANVPPSTYSCSGGTCLTGEVLPTTSRTLTFQLTVRDNRTGGGAIATGSTQLTVSAAAGPFRVTSPNTAVTLAGGAPHTVTWDVAATAAAPIGATEVRILLSADGGTTFPTVLAATTPNDGTQDVTLPGAATNSARIKIEAVGNVFFDVSDTDFSIAAGPATYPLTVERVGRGTGTVTSTSPADAIACGTDCTETVAHGTSVTLGAAASTGSTFAGWSGGGCSGTGSCTVAVTAATTVTATFTLDSYPLTVERVGRGTGTVTSTSPADAIACGTDCTETVAHGTSVTLGAAASAGSTFAGWSGGGCSGTGSCTVAVTAATTVTTTFTLNPLPTYTRYLAEGATSDFFDTGLAILNPGDIATTASLEFARGGSTPLRHQVEVPARTRVSVDPKTYEGLESAAFSVAMTSDQPLVLDRTMTWDRGGYGAHAETSVSSPRLTWYFAEGSTKGRFSLFYLLQNPGPESAEVTVRYLRPSGAPLLKSYTLPPRSRTNIWVNVEQFEGLGMALASADVSAVVHSTNGQPIIAERAMYLDLPGQYFGAGHESAGVTAPSTQWFLAEGATGPFFDLFVLVANPNDAQAELEATYLLPDGGALTRPVTVPPNSRLNIWVDYEDARLADTAVSTTIRSTNGVGVIVERAQWWPGSQWSAEWYEAHNSAGATETGTAWALAEGEVGGARDASTYILIANPSSTPGSAKVTLLFEDGTSDEGVFHLAANSRFNVDVSDAFPSAANRRFGAVVESLGETPARLVVERAMYWSASGQLWAAGTNALATKLR